jgi:hypothetical protein
MRQSILFASLVFLLTMPADASEVSESPDHFYASRKGDAFEYARVSSDHSGARDSVLVWYVGMNRARQPVVRYQDGASTGTLTCFDDCQFVRGTTSIDGHVTHTGRIRITNDPLIYGIMYDARAGRLKAPRYPRHTPPVSQPPAP